MHLAGAVHLFVSGAGVLTPTGEAVTGVALRLGSSLHYAHRSALQVVSFLRCMPNVCFAFFSPLLSFVISILRLETFVHSNKNFDFNHSL